MAEVVQVRQPGESPGRGGEAGNLSQVPGSQAGGGGSRQCRHVQEPASVVEAAGCSSTGAGSKRDRQAGGRSVIQVGVPP